MSKHRPDDVTAEPIGIAIRACKRFLVNAAVFSAFLNLLYLAPTLYMLQVYDRVVPTRGGVTLAMLTAIFVFAVITIACLDLVRTRLLVRASARLDRMLAATIMDALMRVAVGNSAKRNSMVLREFDVLRTTMTGPGVLALFDAPWAPIYVGVCFLIHWALGLMAIFGCIALTSITWLNERATNQPVKAANTISQLAYTAMDNSLASSGVISALGMRDAMVTRHLRERLKSTDMTTRANFKSAAYMAYIKALRLLLQSLALGLGALLAIKQEISPGAIFAASLLISRAVAPIELVTGAWKNIIQSRAAYASLQDLFRERGPVRLPTTLPPPTGALSIENISVASPQRDRLLLNGVTFKLDAGEMLGIIGPSGAGKSTLVRAMVGITPLANGAIRIDGASLPDWPEDQLGDAIGYVPQEPMLYRGTIKENIARFRTELVGAGSLDAEVIRAATLCGAHDFILRLPQAYDTELGWGGTGLSVGQAQRITLARALFGSPAILILDEPNASLDAEGEAQLAEALNALRANKVTVVIVAHRAGILASVDKLMLLRDGRLELFGARNAVLARLGGPPTQVAGGPDGPSEAAPAAAA